MTYRELLATLQTLSPEQLDMDVTVAVGDYVSSQRVFEDTCEFYGAKTLNISTPDLDVLDAEHPYLAVHT